MKVKLWSGYLAKVGLGAGVAVVLGGAPVVAHAEDNMPSGAIQNGADTTSRAATNAGNAAGNAAEKAGDTTSGAANQAGNAASGAADKASDTASGAADKANSATEHAGTMADDSSITAAVKAKLTKGTDTGSINVDTDNGVVTLSGTVHDKSTREHAVHMAKKAKGVKSVKDNIEITPAMK
jgi:hyperosmotically inducible protein